MVDVATLFVAVDPEIGLFQVHFVADVSFKGTLTEAVDEDSHRAFTGPLMFVTALFCIFLCSPNVTSMQFVQSWSLLLRC